MKQTIQQMAADLADRAIEIGLQAEQLPNGLHATATVIALKEAITAMQRAKDALKQSLRKQQTRDAERV